MHRLDPAGAVETIDEVIFSVSTVAQRKGAEMRTQK